MGKMRGEGGGVSRRGEGGGVSRRGGAKKARGRGHMSLMGDFGKEYTTDKQEGRRVGVWSYGNLAGSQIVYAML